MAFLGLVLIGGAILALVTLLPGVLERNLPPTSLTTARAGQRLSMPLTTAGTTVARTSAEAEQTTGDQPEQTTVIRPVQNGDRMPAENPLLLPQAALAPLKPAAPDAGLTPEEAAMTSIVYDTRYRVQNQYNRTAPILFGDPVEYAKVAGILTFRGNNFRNVAAYGSVRLNERTMTQTWRQKVGGLPANVSETPWNGVGWTGQPLLVQWEPEVRRIMNLHPDKKEKNDLVEVIYATLDGNIYFYDLDDGSPTRPPISIGKVPIKGTPAVDPRGWPLLYVGQGDYERGGQRAGGIRIYSLIDGQLLLLKEGQDSKSYRTRWGNCDSSPIVDAASDTLIFPSENGMVYTYRLNSAFDVGAGKITIEPDLILYKYRTPGMVQQGIESSMALYGNLGWFTDNSGQLTCLDLNTMKPVWIKRLQDDADATPVLAAAADGRLTVYAATRVDWQQSQRGEYQGNAHVTRLDALTGRMVWEAAVPCWTYIAPQGADDLIGGVVGTPAIGKYDLNDLIYFNFSMTDGKARGTRLIAFSRDDGRQVWEFRCPGYSWSSPVDVYDQNGKGYLVLPDSDGILHLLDGRSGAELSRLQLTDAQGQPAGNIEASCAVFGDRLVVGTRGGVIAGVLFK